jgi:hypothetical protein
MAEIAKTGFASPKHAALMKQLLVGSTIRLVSNCEDVTDWDISDATNFNAVDETTDKRTGSTAMELVDAGTTKGTFVTLDEAHRPDAEDWTDFAWLCMWVHDDTALRLAGELTIQIKNAGTWSDEVAVPVNSNTDVFEYKCIDISAFARGQVQGLRFVNQRGTGSSEKVYVDNIIVTDLIAGVGDGTQCYTGPVIGQCGIFPVASGQTLNPGEFVNHEACEAHAGVQNDTAVIGCVVQTKDNKFTSVVGSDTAPKEVMVALPGAIVIGRNDGTGSAINDAVMIASGNASLDEATNNFAKYVAEALETATANADTYFMLRKQSVQA